MRIGRILYTMREKKSEKTTMEQVIEAMKALCPLSEDTTGN